MWHVVLIALAAVGILGVLVIGVAVGRLWQRKYKSAVAEGARLRAIAAGGTAGATASAVSTGNVVNIIDRQLVVGDRHAAPLGGSDIWVPLSLHRGAADRVAVGEAEVDALGNYPVRKRLEWVRAALNRGDNTDAIGIDNRRYLAGEDDDPGD